MIIFTFKGVQSKIKSIKPIQGTPNRSRSTKMSSSALYQQVNDRYGAMNRSKTGNYERTVATAFGYSPEELSGIPEGANLGLSCGNPLVLAKLREVRMVKETLPLLTQNRGKQ